MDMLGHIDIDFSRNVPHMYIRWDMLVYLLVPRRGTSKYTNMSQRIIIETVVPSMPTGRLTSDPWARHFVEDHLDQIAVKGVPPSQDR